MDSIWKQARWQSVWKGQVFGLNSMGYHIMIIVMTKWNAIYRLGVHSALNCGVLDHIWSRQPVSVVGFLNFTSLGFRLPIAWARVVLRHSFCEWYRLLLWSAYCEASLSANTLTFHTLFVSSSKLFMSAITFFLSSAARSSGAPDQVVLNRLCFACTSNDRLMLSKCQYI